MTTIKKIISIATLLTISLSAQPLWQPPKQMFEITELTGGTYVLTDSNIKPIREAVDFLKRFSIEIVALKFDERFVLFSFTWKF